MDSIADGEVATIRYDSVVAVFNPSESPSEDHGRQPENEHKVL